MSTYNMSCLPCCGGFSCLDTDTLYVTWSINDIAAPLTDSQTRVPVTNIGAGNWVNNSPPGPATNVTVVLDPCGGPPQASVQYGTPGFEFYNVQTPDPPSAVPGEPYNSGVMTLYRATIARGTIQVTSG